MRIPPECAADIERRNAVIRQANEEIAQLQAGGLNVSAKEGIYGVEITIERPTWRNGHVSRSTRIIPWRK